MPTKINVPYTEKDIAKGLGAKWDPKDKTWYVPDNVELKNFTKWIENSKINIIADDLYIAVSNERCWKCNAVSPVVSLGSINFTYVETESGYDPYNIEFDNELSFFTAVKHLSDDLSEYIKKNVPFYFLDYSKTIESKYWMNHCKYCNAKFGDFYLHESGGSFIPYDTIKAEDINLIEISDIDELEFYGNLCQSEAYQFISEASPRITIEEFVERMEKSIEKLSFCTRVVMAVGKILGKKFENERPR